MRLVMTRVLPATAIAGAVALIALGTGGPAPAEGPGDRGVALESFAFAIGNHTLDGDADAVGARYAGFDLVVVDGEEAKPAEIDAIEAEGGLVLGYLSVGTIEKWRGWYGEVKRYRLQAWQDWKDEWFADTSKAGYRDAVEEIAQGLLDKGFDGLFLDNVDMVEVRRHRGQRAGMGQLVAALDTIAGSRLLYDQNGAPGMLDGYPGQGVDPLVSHFDGWNREDVTWTYDFDRKRYVRNRDAWRHEALDELEEIGDAGLVTTATDYVNLENQSTAAECESGANAASVGALSYVADIGLTARAVVANPPDC